MNKLRFPSIAFATMVLSSWFIMFVPVHAEDVSLAAEENPIEIVATEDRTIYEYRRNGILTMIKVVPKKGPAYYLVPADGSLSFDGLDHEKKLYPGWVLLEW